MRMARADQAQLDLMTEWLNRLEELLSNEDQGDLALGQWVRETFETHRMDEHQRIVFGYQVLIENACDKTLSYLDFPPWLKEAIQLYNEKHPDQAPSTADAPESEA